MPSLPAPQARRLAKPSWRDTRLVVGVVLIAIGILVGTRAVAAADRSVEVYSARHALVPGQQIGEKDLVLVRVRLGQTDRYLAAGQAPAPGAVVVTPVGEGELVPHAAVGVADDVAMRAVAVPAADHQRQWLRPADSVDIWVTPKEGAGRKPVRLLAGALIAAVPGEDARGLGPRGSSAAVQVLVPSARVGDVIGAVDREDSITLVPVRRGA